MYQNHLEEKVLANVGALNEQELQRQQEHRSAQVHVLFQRPALHDEGAIVLGFDGQLASAFHSLVLEDGAKAEDQHKEAALNLACSKVYGKFVPHRQESGQSSRELVRCWNLNQI